MNLKDEEDKRSKDAAARFLSKYPAKKVKDTAIPKMSLNKLLRQQIRFLEGELQEPREERRHHSFDWTRYARVPKSKRTRQLEQRVAELESKLQE